MSGSTRWIVMLVLLVVASMSVVGVRELTSPPAPTPMRTEARRANVDTPPRPSPPPGAVHRALATLQYVMNDYANAVDPQGRVLNTNEYAEQATLLEEVTAFLDTHAPAAAEQARAFRSQLSEVRDLVDARAEPWLVHEAIAALRDAMIGAYGVRAAPETAPSIAAGAALYMEACAACHGDDGRGRTLAAARLDPRPGDLHAARAGATLSPYHVFNIVTFGVEGTGMPAYPTLDEQQRWDLAFYVLSMRHAAPAQPGAAAHDASTPPPLDVLARCTDVELATWLQANGVAAPDVAPAVDAARIQPELAPVP